MDSKEKEQFQAELVTLQEGQHYRVDLTWTPVLPGSGRLPVSFLRLYSNHPDLPLKELQIQGWVAPE